MRLINQLSVVQLEGVVVVARSETVSKNCVMAGKISRRLNSDRQEIDEQEVERN